MSNKKRGFDAGQAGKVAGNRSRPPVAPVVLIPFFIAILSGCMMTASARNDFSDMGNDVFSNLVKDSILENFGPHGYEGIRFSYIKEEGEKYFFGKKNEELFSVFNKNGGNCAVVNSSVEQGVQSALICEVSRKWKIVNSGYPSFGILKETLTSSEPGVKLIFKFHLSSEKYVTTTEIKNQDITSYQKIY